MNHPVTNHFRISAMLLMMALAAVSCGPRPVILDTDWWTDVDDAMAVRLALRADERDEIRLMGICVDAVRETSIPSLRAFLQLEGRPEIPLGADLDATDYNGEPCYHDLLISAAGAWRRQLRSRASTSTGLPYPAPAARWTSSQLDIQMRLRACLLRTQIWCGARSGICG